MNEGKGGVGEGPRAEGPSSAAIQGKGKRVMEAGFPFQATFWVSASPLPHQAASRHPACDHGALEGGRITRVALLGPGGTFGGSPGLGASWLLTVTGKTKALGQGTESPSAGRPWPGSLKGLHSEHTPSPTPPP